MNVKNLEKKKRKEKQIIKKGKEELTETTYLGEQLKMFQDFYYWFAGARLALSLVVA